MNGTNYLGKYDSDGNEIENLVLGIGRYYNVFCDGEKNFLTNEEEIYAIAVAGVYIYVYDFQGNCVGMQNISDNYDTLAFTLKDEEIYAISSNGVYNFILDVIGKIIPSEQEITVPNKKQQFKITANVNEYEEVIDNQTVTMRGGNIIRKDEDNNEISDDFETVEYAENSKQTIIAVPEDGYKVINIKVNGEEIEFTSEKDGSVILEQFTNVKEEKDILVTFSNTKSNVFTHHLLAKKNEDGTYTYTEIKLAEDDNITDTIGKPYTTSPRVDIDKFELIKDNEGNVIIPNNAYGTYTKDAIDVNYYYEIAPINLTIHHYLEGTENKISIENEEVLDEVITINSNVELDSSGNYTVISNGSYKIDTNENYQSLLSTYELTSVTSTVESELSADSTLEFTDNVELTYYYKPKTIAKVNVKYLEKDTKQELASMDTIDTYVGEIITTNPAVIQGYRTAEVETSDGSKSIVTYEDMTKFDVTASNTMTEEIITLVYWYEEIPKGTITVKYIGVTELDINGEYTLESGKEIADSESILAQIDVDTVITRKEFTDPKTGRNYIFVDGPIGNEKVIVIGKDEDSYTIKLEEADLDKAIEVRFYYESQYNVTTKVKAHTENGVEVKGGSISGDGESVYEVINSKASNGKEIEIKPDANYQIKSLTVNGEELNVANLKEENGCIKLNVGYFEPVTEDKNIIVEFEKIPAKVIIKYLEDGTEKEIADKTIKEGIIGDSYETEAKNIEGYTLVESKLPENKEGTMTKEDITVVYYYSKKEEQEDKPKDEPIDEPKDEQNDEPKDEPKEEPKDEPKDEQKDEPKDEPKDESKDEPKDEPKGKPNDELKNEQENKPAPTYSDIPNENVVVENGGEVNEEEANVTSTYEDIKVQTPKISKVTDNPKTEDNILNIIGAFIIATFGFIYTQGKLLLKKGKDSK